MSVDEAAAKTRTAHRITHLHMIAPRRSRRTGAGSETGRAIAAARYAGREDRMHVALLTEFAVTKKEPLAVLLERIQATFLASGRV